MEGAASVFIAYEGLQLLGYDYRDIARVLLGAGPPVVGVATAVYVVVALGAASLIGAAERVAQREMALAVAEEAWAGNWASLW